tara:strand:- start:244 stop:501 length:258 start_codon:yes stop_codon:yes gene_type:complete
MMRLKKVVPVDRRGVLLPSHPLGLRYNWEYAAKALERYESISVGSTIVSTYSVTSTIATTERGAGDANTDAQRKNMLSAVNSIPV